MTARASESDERAHRVQRELEEARSIARVEMQAAQNRADAGAERIAALLAGLRTTREVASAIGNDVRALRRIV